MAIYNLSAKVISRADGRSSVAAAAYRSAQKLRDDRQGLEHDYTRKGGVVHVEIMAPADAPDWMRDRNQLWNAVETVEKRRDAQLAREIEVALPRELDWDEQLDLVTGFVQREFVDRGMIADFAIHEAKARDGNEQTHAHIMLTMRELTGDGFGKKDRNWNAPDLLLKWREAWSAEVNTALERAGRSERIDHRSLNELRAEAEYKAEQARSDRRDDLATEHEKRVIELTREPEPKVGPIANAMEKRGIQTERGDLLREAQTRNEKRKDLGLQRLNFRPKFIERRSAFITGVRDRLRNIWVQAEVTMSFIKDKIIGLFRNPSENEDIIDDSKRRAANLGRDFGHIDLGYSDIENYKNISYSIYDDRRRAVIGRHKNKQKERKEDYGIYR